MTFRMWENHMDSDSQLSIMFSPFFVIVFGVVLGTGLMLYKIWGDVLFRNRLPPGPSGFPFVGNMVQFFRARNRGQLGQFLLSLPAYGEMTTLHMGSHTWIVLNSKRVVSEIIAKRSRITNDRPEMPIAGTLVSHDKRTVIRRTKQWIEGRRVMHQLLSGSALKTYGQWQEIESIQLLLSYLEQPETWYAHHFRYSTSILHRIVMGERLTKSREQLDEYQQVTMEFLSSLLHSPVDYFPILSRLPRPLQFWRKHWEDMGNSHRQLFWKWWEPVQKAVREHRASASFVRDVLLHPDTKYTGDDEEAMYLATSVMAAGGDNLRMTMNVFVMACLCYPDAFRRARQEIDLVCGTEVNANRLPTLAEIESMPYLCAFVKEVFRWRPTVPLIPPHQLTEDLEFEGYRFQKEKTLFLINTFAVCNECTDADNFRPERWLDDNPANITQDFWGFGGGRRICVGYRIAQQALMISVSRLIYTFNFSAVGPYNSKDLGHKSLTQPFPVKVTVRSQAHGKLILEEAAKHDIQSPQNL